MTRSFLKRSLALYLVVAAAGLAGCAVKMPAATTNAETVEKVRGARIQPAAVGGFTLAPGKNPEMDKTLGGLRGSSLSPASGSFSQQLKDELVAALKGAGLYDERSPRVITGQLTDSQVDAGMSVGTGRLAARFIVTRAGAQVYDKEVAVDAKWESSFVGATALPAAINQYGALYKSLVSKLMDDPAFRAAMAQ